MSWVATLQDFVITEEEVINDGFRTVLDQIRWFHAGPEDASWSLPGEAFRELEGHPNLRHELGLKFKCCVFRPWQDYSGNEDKILKRAYLAGFPHAKYKLRGQQYQVDFASMSQKNMRSGKSREIRAPYKWKQPEKPIVEPGPTFCIKVPPGSPGTCIHVPHPAKKGQFIAVNVPAKAKVGAAMLVPIPKDEDLPTPVPDAPTPSGPTPAAPTPAAPATEEEKKKGGWSTGAKVAAGTAGVVAVGGLAVAGAVLGEHIAEEGWDATMAELGDVAADAGEAISGEDCWISLDLVSFWGSYLEGNTHLSFLKPLGIPDWWCVQQHAFQKLWWQTERSW